MRVFPTPLMLSPLIIAIAHAEVVEFDPAMLMTLPNQTTIDISRFNHSGAISAGNYRLDVYVNGKYKGRTDVQYFDENPHSKNAKLCVNEELLAKLDTKRDIRQSIIKQADGCYELSALANHRTELDISAMRLDISVPQVYLIDRPHDHIDPASWDKGVNSAFVSYQFNHHQIDHQHSTHENYLGLHTGINVGRWHVRHQGFAKNATAHTTKESTDYQALNTFVHTNLPALQSQMILGDFYTDSTLFDSHAMRGVQLMSDERMLPASMQGFAPTIRGIANSNAKVSIFQNNQEIYSTTVPAGAFELNHIGSIGSSGDLTVVITETDGRQTQQIVPYHSTIALLRPNQHRHAYAFGRMRHQNTHLYDSPLIQGSWQQGLTNTWTLNAGFQYSPHHRSLLLGSLFNTTLGAFSVNTINSQYSPFDKSTKQGQQLRLTYHRLITPSKTNIHASVRYYRHDESLETIFWSHDHEQTPTLTKPKYHYQVSISQPLGNNWGSLYGLFGRTKHDNNQQQDQWQIGYNHHFGRLNYGIFAQNTKSADTQDRQYFLNISLPLGEDSLHHFHGSTTHDDRQTQHQVGIFGKFKDLPYFDYGASAGYDEGGVATWSANANYQTPFVKLSTSMSDDTNRKQYSLGASGAIVAHKGGLTATNKLADTFAIVHLPHGKGASMNDGDNVRFDKNGYAILSNLAPYRPNTLTINPQGLPHEVQLASTSSQATPIANASIYVKFDSQLGRLALLTVKLADGNYPAMGASVFDKNGTMVGFVAQEGRIFLQNAQETDTLTINLGSDQTCQVGYHLPQNSTTPISHISTTCQ